MEHYDVLVNAISTLGFPIIVSIALFWYINQKDKNHKEEINSLRSSLDRNSSILEELKTLINVITEQLKG